MSTNKYLIGPLLSAYPYLYLTSDHYTRLLLKYFSHTLVNISDCAGASLVVAVLLKEFPGYLVLYRISSFG